MPSHTFVFLGRPGLEVKYFVDPANMNIGENEAFLSYLHSHILHVDVWDGDSLMLVGSVGIPLMVIYDMQLVFNTTLHYNI